MKTDEMLEVTFFQFSFLQFKFRVAEGATADMK